MVTLNLPQRIPRTSPRRLRLARLVWGLFLTICVMKLDFVVVVGAFAPPGGAIQNPRFRAPCCPSSILSHSTTVFYENDVNENTLEHSPRMFARQQQQQQQPHKQLMVPPPTAFISVGNSVLSSTSTIGLPTSPVAWILVHVLGGLLGVPVVATGTKAGGWYRRISLPSWTPPDRLFGPVWTVLYSSMGLVVSKIVQALSSSSTSLVQKERLKCLLVLWTVHYALNLSWAPTFFGRKKLRLGLIINGLLFGSLIGAILPLLYTLLSPGTAAILLPYTAWVGFATFLNYSICKQNPTLQGYNDAMFQSDLAKLQQEAASKAGLEGSSSY